MTFARLGKISAVMAALLTALSSTAQAQAAEPILGEIRSFAFDFCPRSFMPADGQILQIAEYTSLFSLYGTTYGGDGRATFALPDLRGRVLVHVGAGPGLSLYSLGQTGGTETTVHPSTQIRNHAHTSETGNTEVEPVIVDTTNGEAFSNRDPYIALTWCVAVEGAFPSRN